MPVTASDAALPVTHDGVTYYFCCAGCHQRFSENPDAYAKAVLR
jgi:YHS domain-containing protein